MKFGTGVLYRKLLTEIELCENWRSIRHILHIGIDEICLHFLHYRPILIKTGWQNVHNNSLWKCEFHDDRCSERRTLLLSSVNNLNLYFLYFFVLIWLEFSIQDLNIMILSICGRRVGPTFLTGSNKMAFTWVLTPLSVSPPHSHHSITIHHLAEAWQQTRTFMNVSLQVPSLFITAVGHI